MAKSYQAFKNTNALSKLAIAIVCANSSMTFSAPSGGSIVSGQGTIASDQLSLDQSQNAVNDVVTVQWNEFNLDPGETFHFIQDAGDVAINNILDAAPSSILGNIEASGTVFLSNSNGFIFGANSSINTGAFLATTSDIAFSDNTDSLVLTDSGLPGSISIHKDANINANQQDSTGYLAFISKDISIDSSSSSGNLQSGLHANNGEVLISNDVNSTIKLAGLNINFPASTFIGSDSTNIDLSDSTISSKTVILTSKNLTNLLDSVIKQPESLNIESLSISAPEITANSNISTSIEEAYELLSTSNNGNNLSLTTDDFSLNNTLKIDHYGQLNVQADSITLKHNIFAKDLDLNLIAKDNATINIGMDEPSDIDDHTLGGINGLNSVSISASSIDIYENIYTKNNISLDGPVQFHTENNTKPIISSVSGTILISDSITDSSGRGELLLRADTLDLNEVSNFEDISLDANTVYLSGELAANNISSGFQSSIYLKDNIDLKAQNIEFNSSNFTSYSEDPSVTYNLHLIGTGNDNIVSLDNSKLHDSDNGNRLNEIRISSTAIDSITNAFIGGEYEVSNFCMHSCSSNTNNINANYNLGLKSDTNFSNIATLNISEATLTGNYQFQSTANDNSGSTADLSSIIGLEGFSLSNFESIILREDISTNEAGLELLSTNIILDKNAFYGDPTTLDKTVSLNNLYSGDIILSGLITSANDGNLYINSKNSHVVLNEVNNLHNLTIRKDLKGEGSTTLGGNINVSNNIVFSKLGDIEATVNGSTFVNADITLSASNNITLFDSNLVTPNHNIGMSANTITLDDVTANKIDFNSANIELNGNLQSETGINFLGNGNANILLKEDITITGEIDFLSSDNTFAHITGDKNLSIYSHNSDIYLSTFNTANGLNSLSISTADSNIESNVFFATDENDMIIMPDLNGVEGLSLQGSMKLAVGDSGQIFDTSSYNGNLNLSGVSITGGGELTFDTGTGELSLGDIGHENTDEQIFSALNLNSTGKLNLYGNLNITPENFDFSNLNTIELHTDLILGSSDAPYKVDFGSTSINGTYDLTLYSNDLTLGAMGNNIALQDLTIISDSNLSLTKDISVVGTVNINSNDLFLDNTISATGLDVNILTQGDLIMSKDSSINAAYNDISLTSTSGNIGIGELIARGSVTVRSELGYLYNSIDDYISNDVTSTNIMSTSQNLFGLSNIGQSVASPIVIDVINNGSITAESTGTIYIANLANVKVNATGRVIDGSTGGETASIDAFTQFKLASLNTTNLPTLHSNIGLISNSAWQVDEDESIRKINSPTSAPSIYYSRFGWRLGQ